MSITSIFGRNGSWGLPEFGITEGIGNLLGQGRTAQGGSNLIASSGQPTAQANTGSGFTPIYGPALGWTGSSNYSSTPVNNTPINTINPSGGGGQVLGTNNVVQTSGPSQEEIDRQNAENQLNSGYNDYFASLDQALNGTLPAQRDAATGVVNSQYTQGLSDLDYQRQTNQDVLTGQRTTANTNQEHNLKTLASNLRNQFNQGQMAIGAGGGGDSSAVNQYSYALTKLGSQQRGDIMSNTNSIYNDINAREANLNNLYLSEKQKLSSQKEQAIYGVVQWFEQAKQTLAGERGAALLQKSQQAYQLAVNQLQTIQQQSANQASLLDQWTVNHATTLAEAKAGLSKTPATGYNLPQAGSLPQLSFNNTGSQAYYPGSNNTTEKQKNWWA